MSATDSASTIAKVICPQCFEQFVPEDVLWISEHQDLFGKDDRVPEEQLRFLPSRFTASGQAVDPRGFPCHRLACVNCHLEVPRPMLELSPFFLSILGAPGCGKSYYLAAMASQLRRTLPLLFHTSFNDADATMNARLRKTETGLFANNRPDQVRMLHELIEKTQEEGDGYASVNFGTQSVQYRLPFIFTMRMEANHPNPAVRGFGRSICLYDNAGESFLPGSDRTAAPVTRHLAQSRILFFVYDPMQDSRFRALDPAMERGTIDKSHLGSQDSVFQEAARRIRMFAGLSTAQKYKRRVIVVVTKSDRWLHLLDRDLLTMTPVVDKMVTDDEGTAFRQNCVDVNMVRRVSGKLRDLLIRTTPEIVSAVEGFSERVDYIPVSATGMKTQVDDETSLQSMRPGDAKPLWAEVPFLYALAASSMGLLPRA